MMKSKKACKKKAGTGTSFIIAAITMVAILVLMMMQVDSTTNVTRVQKVEQIGREYLLRMESDGCLTQSEQTNLQTELTSLGYVSNIVITAPTSAAGYGEKITLKIEYDMQVKKMSGTDLFQIKRTEVTMRKTFQKSTTSKH